MKKKLGLAIAGVLICGPALTHSASLNTFSADGTLENFSSIDWHSNGGGWVQGFDLSNSVGATDDFTVTYQAFAASVGSTSPTPSLSVAAPGPQNGTWELTTYGTINETATCVAAGASACSAISLTTNSGTWQVFLDSTSPDANQSSGTGFLDGGNIISGTWDSGSSTFIYNGDPQGPHTAEIGMLNGTVTMTNETYVNPDLLGTSFQAVLQFPGEPAPLFTRPAEFNGVATSANSLDSFVIQVNSSQHIAAIPEPETYAMFLAGLALLSFLRPPCRKTCTASDRLSG